MAIDLKKIKERLETLKNTNKKTGILKLENGKQTVRLLPLKDGDLCKSFYLHYNVSGEGGILCPKANFGESCAICEFVAKLFSEETEESRNMAKNLMKKQRFFSPVLVRGKEKEGVKLWSYSKTVYEFLLKAALDPENGDITDKKLGTDIDIEYGKRPGKLYPDTIPTLKRKTSPLCSKDLLEEECEELLSHIPDMTKLFKTSSSEEVKILLDKHLATGTGEQSEVEFPPTEIVDEKSNIDQVLESLRE